MPEPHPVHVQPPALRVVLVHLGTAHLQLQAWREDPLHSLLHCVLTPVSGHTDGVIISSAPQGQICSKRSVSVFYFQKVFIQYFFLYLCILCEVPSSPAIISQNCTHTIPTTVCSPKRVRSSVSICPDECLSLVSARNSCLKTF